MAGASNLLEDNFSRRRFQNGDLYLAFAVRSLSSRSVSILRSAIFLPLLYTSCEAIRSLSAVRLIDG